MYSSAGQRGTLDTLREFEQVRGFFLQVFNGPPANPVPVRLVAFGSLKEYEPYRPNEFATAYYHDSVDRDYIVMSRAGADIFPLAVHEYVHLLARHQGLKLPPWLGEGLAEVYSTLRPQGGKILVGDIIPGRMRALFEGKWVPLEIILGADHNSPYYNEKSKAGNLYNEGWALTHMLYFREEYRPKFSQMVQTISNGKDSVAALTEVYGKTLGQIDKDLQSHLRSDTFHAFLVTAKLDKVTDDIPVETLPDFDAGLMLADLMYRPGKGSEQRAVLQRLNEQDPKRPEPYRGLGYLAWREGNTDEARKQFGLAFEHGGRDPKMLWDYGRLIRSEHRDVAIQVFSELMKSDAARVDVRLELADLQLREGTPKAAIATLTGIHTITPADAPRFFRIAVYAHLQDGDLKDAEATAKRFLEVSKGDADRAAAQLLISDVARRTPRSAAAVASADGERPLLRRAESTPPQPEPVAVPVPVAQPTIAGRFVELDCRGKEARMIVDTGTARKVMLIDDPEKVRITGQSDWQIDMACGPQKSAAKVEIGYDPAAGQTGIDGLVRTLAYK